MPCWWLIKLLRHTFAYISNSCVSEIISNHVLPLLGIRAWPILFTVGIEPFWEIGIQRKNYSILYELFHGSNIFVISAQWTFSHWWRMITPDRKETWIQKLFFHRILYIITSILLINLIAGEYICWVRCLIN